MHLSFIQDVLFLTFTNLQFLKDTDRTMTKSNKSVSTFNTTRKSVLESHYNQDDIRLTDYGSVY